MSLSNRFVVASVLYEVEDAKCYSCWVRMYWFFYFFWLLPPMVVSGSVIRGGRIP